MKTQTVHSWTTDDPSVDFVLHAVNRLASFRETGDDPKPLNRVAKGNEFTREDILAVCGYLQTLARRARDKWGRLSQLPSATDNERAMAESIFQAAGNAEQAATDLHDIFFHSQVSTHESN